VTKKANSVGEWSPLKLVNTSVYVLSLLGAITIFFSSFNQCTPGEDYSDCIFYPDLYSDYTNVTQIGIALAIFLFSSLIYTFINSIEAYISDRR
jgi:hypothetical protein